LRKYWHVIKIGIENTLVYRVNFLFRVIFGLIPLIATLSLWRAIYSGEQTGIAGYSLAEMTSYYLVVTIVDALTAVSDDDWQIAADIKDGNISQFLIKPLDYLTYRLCLFGAGRIIYTAVALSYVSALPLRGWADHLHGGSVCAGDPVHFLAPELLCFSGGWRDLGVVYGVNRADRSSPVFHFLRAGVAGVLAAGGFNFNLHRVRF
jgi:hypothetical protein